jgi:acyl-CoA reductase-like NAD-dependent aldehyde dehydrogenase
VFFLANAFVEAGLPAGMFNLVTGGDQVGRRLAEHSGVDMVSFTGSTAVGRSIAVACGSALKRCTLELGGKSAGIVLEDADVPAAAALIGGGVFAGAGQYCRALTRVLAPRARYVDVVDALASVAGRFRPGDPYDAATTMSPLNSERQRARVETYVELAGQEGARLVVGGRRPPELARGWFYEPTVFAEATNDMRFVQEEIFGPVIAVVAYDSIDEAIAVANDNEYGLSGAVFSTDERAALDVASRVRTGTTGVNLHGARSCAPCGGTKASGIGQEHGPEGFLEYLDPKAVNISEALARQLEAEGVPAMAPVL